MKTKKRKVELLAPAGNRKALLGAISAGADAIYLGGSRYGARAYADNFSEEELIACIRYAHIFGRKIYLTVNTLVKESEFSELYDYIAPYYKAGLDGVIIQDIGVFSFLREHFRGMELHVSTQMTITGEFGAGILKDMGACRVVPARELCLDEIVAMKAATGMEIEAFIHGAMCYCYSGQCLFSSILGGRSGNRGRCAQPCRLPYSVKESKEVTKECYPLSLKDMCTIEQLPELIEAGIDSFKIEGRMKKPEYAAGVTAIYRKYIDKYYEAPHKTFQVSEEDLDKLSRLYIRSERQNGYYHKHNGRDMVTLESPAYSGNDEVLLEEIRTQYLEKELKLPVEIFGYFKIGEKAIVTYLSGEYSVTIEGEVVQPASRQPVSEENIRKQLGKLGDTVFSVETMDIVLDEQAFYSLKALNELRREAIAELETGIITAHGLVSERKLVGKQTQCTERIAPEQKPQQSEDVQRQLHVSVQTFSQLETLTKSSYFDRISRIYLNGDILITRNMSDVLGLLTPQMEAVIAMPYILRQRDSSYLEELMEIAEKYSKQIKGIRVSSLEAMGYLMKKEYPGKLYGDFGFYIWNTEALRTWSNSLDGFCMPLELRGKEQRALLKEAQSCEKLFYGRIPMMITANCVAKTTQGCRKGLPKDRMFLVDRYQKEFPLVYNCMHCMNIIYNTVPLSLHNEWKRWKHDVDMRIDFTIEEGAEAVEVMDFFGKLFCEETDAREVIPPFQEYTTGHEKRGVE